MKSTLFLSLVFSLNFGSFAETVPKSNMRSPEINRLLIDRHIESVGEQLRAGNHKTACVDALKAAKLIKIHLASLKSLEPDYNWKEMREVLLEVSPKYCK